MKTLYCAIDVETTGLDSWRHQILEVACVIDGIKGSWKKPVEDLPTLRFLVDHGHLRGEPAALAMNQRILAELAKPSHERSIPALAPAKARESLIEFWMDHFRDRKVVLAGKNAAGFDVPFLKGLWGEHDWPRELFHYRVLDPGMLYFDPRTDTTVPGLPECCKRAGIPFAADHDALADCRAVIQLLRAYYCQGAGISSVP